MKHTEGRSFDSTIGQGSRRGRRRARRTGRTASMPRSRPEASALEQFLKQNASSLTFLGVTLSVFVSKKFVILPVAIALMLAQDVLGKAGLARAREAVRS